MATLQRVVQLSYRQGNRTPWAKTVCTCHKLLQVADYLWTFLEIEGIDPTNIAGERALSQSLIQRKISHGVQSHQGAICRSRLLTVTTTLRQQGRDVREFMKRAWIAHHRGGVMPSLLPDTWGLLRKVSLTSAGNTGVSTPACRMILRRKQADHSTPPHGSGRLLYGPAAAVASRPKGQKEALGACRGS